MNQFLFEAALKATVMLLLVFGVAALLRRASAAARHTVWSSGFAGLLALPFLATTLPWRLEVLPAAANVAVPSTPAGETDPVTQDEPPTAASVANFPSPIPSSATTETKAFNAGQWLVALWLVGAGLVVGRLVLGWFLMTWLTRRAEPLDDPAWQDLLDAAERRLGITARVRLLKNSQIPLPMTSGLLRPVIVLPADCEDWTTDRRYAVLLHELAHVRRGDLWVHFLVQAACACYWFHPLAWTAARRLRSESERACDDLVLTAGTPASDYAGHLLQLVRRAGDVRAPAVALPMAQRSDFEGRLLAILEPTVSRRPLAPLTALATAVTVAFLAVPLAAMSPTRPGVTVVEALQSPTPTPTPTVRIQERSRPRPVRTPAPDGEAPRGRGPRPAVSVHVDADAIGAIAEEAVRGLTTAIAQHAPRIAREASTAAVRGLVAALRDTDIEVRRHAAQSLGGVQDTAAINALADALTRDADAEVRKTAAWALGEIEDSRAVAALVQALRNDKDADVRKTAAWALGQIEDPAAIDGLGAALNDGSVEVRKTAVWALGEIEDARAVPALLPFLKDSDVEIRKTAVWALGQIESPAAVTGLATLVRDPNAEVRKQVAWALGEIESAAAIDPLTTMVRDEDVEVRSMVVWALGQIEDPRAVPAVTAALGDASAEVRQKAVWALGEIGARTAPPGLLNALKDSDREVRKTAAWAAGEIGDPAAVPGLTVLLKDGDNEIRRTALWALGEIGDTTAFDAIVAALKDADPEVRRAAAQALGRRH